VLKNNATETEMLHNGGLGHPNAIALIYGPYFPHTTSFTIIDTVSYDGDTVSPWTEGTGLGDDNGNNIFNIGFSRIPDGFQSYNNSADFRAVCITPGHKNELVEPPSQSPQLCPAAGWCINGTHVPMRNVWERGGEEFLYLRIKRFSDGPLRRTTHLDNLARCKADAVYYGEDPAFGILTRRAILIAQGNNGYWFPAQPGLVCQVLEVKELTVIGDQNTWLDSPQMVKVFNDPQIYYAGIGFSKRDGFGTRGVPTWGVYTVIALRVANCPYGRTNYNGGNRD